MARAKRTKSDETSREEKNQHGSLFSSNEAAWGGFINIRLGEEQKQTFVAWFESSVEAIPSYVDDILGEGGKLSLSFDLPNSAYIVTLVGSLVSNSNERYASTSRAGSLTEALGLTVWKHFLLCDGDYGNYRPQNSTFMKWG